MPGSSADLAEPDMPMKPEQILAQQLKKHFDHDGRYLQNQKASLRALGPERIIVKIPNQEIVQWSGVVTIPEEEALRLGAFAQGQDPLAKYVDGADKLPSHRWMYMGWLENGTLGDFMTRATRAKKPLPNRLLWEIFGCFVRMCIAIAWSDAHDSTQVRLEQLQSHVPPHINFNPDFNTGNMVFGKFVPNNPEYEHSLSPILTMIDLGLIDRQQTPNPAAWSAVVKEIIREIGEQIYMLIGAGGRSDDGSALDPDLNSLAIWCMTGELTAKPSIHELARAVEEGMSRTPQWYNTNKPGEDDEVEADDKIIGYVQELILNPHVDPALSATQGP
ncbi:hypothetical protein BKA67DRAFT_535411 [Truncatella angustata]|uniref:Protein kinase domain-containing protein n=1 Tax=Truncatella angustata TaxID=152316 RepID=A0A9P8UL18_9PEZI|nr:uncharacterized protein BKA67DRAFT_535411 [Truncatella angustata]KAH6654069.1 hypothetical protein BKA67DRAFT_535411 [Truncatella angustata]